MEAPETRSSRYDVVVVGAGPAGISAAINVANRKRTVVVMDGQPPFAKTRKARSIPNYPGFTYASGEELAAAFVAHLEEFGVPHLREKVSKILSDDEGFLVFTDRDAYHAGAVVLATGVYREAELEGEEELVGQGVSYCVTCDGRLFAGREVAFVSYSADGEEEASILADDFGTTVTYLPLYAGDYDLPEGVRVLPRVRPERLTPRGRQSARAPAGRGVGGGRGLHPQAQRVARRSHGRVGIGRPPLDRGPPARDRRPRRVRGGRLHRGTVPDSKSGG